ncbi:hypothetical protein O0L34_g9077 [Tuta absoluta]|nr:hypothetical protein O0L34_g9077 [Tuta absoluta]
MMFQLVSVVALLGAFSQTSAHVGEGGHLTQDLITDLDPHYYCGRNLAKILADLCVRDEIRNGKRSSGEKELSYYYNVVLNPHYKERDSMTWPWISRHRALEAKVRGRRSQGVATECCDKPCDVDELLSYC